MPNVATILKTEISRIARKEIRAETDSLKKIVSTQRTHIASLRRQLDTLDRKLKRLERGAPTRAAAGDSESTSARQVRFSAKRLAAHRAKLGLSANDYGALIGVSGQSIYKWESDEVRPRAGQLQAIATIRGIGKREAATRLEALENA